MNVYVTPLFSTGDGIFIVYVDDPPTINILLWSDDVKVVVAIIIVGTIGVLAPEENVFIWF